MGDRIDALPHIRDLVADRVGQVLTITPGEGVQVMWRKGWSEWMTAERLNSGRYEQVS